ncbi:hypothetical protein D9M71_546140 [compost metagenome]
MRHRIEHEQQRHIAGATADKMGPEMWRDKALTVQAGREAQHQDPEQGAPEYQLDGSEALRALLDEYPHQCEQHGGDDHPG